MVCTGGQLSLLVGLCWFYLSLTKGENCTTAGKYGSLCQYDCHCESTLACDRHSGCGGRCARGWDGMTCQRQNVALDGRASQSSDYLSTSHANKSIDGKESPNNILGGSENTCSATGVQQNDFAVWNLSLSRPYNIYRFTHYYRYCCRHKLIGSVFSVGSSSADGSGYTECYKDPGQVPPPVLHQTCTNGPIRGDLIQMKSSIYNTHLTLCEVLIYVCSPGWYGEMCEMECNSTDMCLQCSENQLDCETCHQGKWGTYCNETCWNCLDGRQCNIATGVCPKTGDDRCAAGYSGDMCDQGCKAGKYGKDCKENCGQCANGTDQCAKDSGMCNNTSPRCAPGFEGDICKTNCSVGKYGADCVEQCGHCAQQCPADSGICPGLACSPGYKGDRCEDRCDIGTYGDGCNTTCGACKGGNSTCSHVDGSCPSCLSGWHGSWCKQECTDGAWGEDCKGKCSVKCKLGPTKCDKYNGSCDDGCLDGFTGDMCLPLSASEAPKMVDVGATVGGVSAGVIALTVVVVVIIILVRRRRRTAAKGRTEGTDNLHLEADRLENDPILRNEARRGGGDEYYNVVTFEAEHTAVAADELESYTRSKKAPGGLKIEFENLPTGLKSNHEVAKKPENKAKSRYFNIVAYDHSRVVLNLLEDDPHSDYINACYIHGYREENKYIASQGPNAVILNDFWRMIWQVNTGKVVMLTNLVEGTKHKCDQYWPDSTSEMRNFGSIHVTLSEENEFANFTVRTLHVINKKDPGRTKVINQFHFTSWPDHGAPKYATGLLDFRDKVHSTETTLTGPMVVHCSAGIGRTGTFIGLDYLIKQAREDGIVDVPACVRLMRQQKVNMIQTVEQYEFLYEALVEALEMADSSVSSANFPNVYRDLRVVNPATGESKLDEQFQVLKDMSPTLSKTDMKTALLPENKDKNRDLKILAADKSRPFLSTPVPGTNNYINAVFLPAYQMQRAFILTQMPLPVTVVDLWRLIYEQDVCSIIMLNSVEQAAEDAGIYWPETADQYGPFGIETLEMEDLDFYTTRTLQCTFKKEFRKNKPTIKQFQYKHWEENLSSTSLVALIEDVERWQQKMGNGPVLVHCMDGASQSGLYCVISAILQRLKVNQEVNILQTIKQMRVNRPEIITNIDQFQFIHDAVLAYLGSLQTYANFQ